MRVFNGDSKVFHGQGSFGGQTSWDELILCAFSECPPLSSSLGPERECKLQR